MKHGTASTYNNYKCRCDECKSAKRDHSAAWRLAHPDYESTRHSKRKDRVGGTCADCGQPTTYAHRGKPPAERCQSCRNAHVAVGHGGSGARYQNGCRCEECRAANARRQREYQQRRRGAAA